MKATAPARNQTCLFGLVLVISMTFGQAAFAAKNIKPIANAGPDQQTTLASTVTLDGTGSSDQDGRITKYQWSQTQGIKVKLLGAKTAKPSFTSPAKLKKNTQSATLVFKLKVIDNKNSSTTDSLSVQVTPSPICYLPQILQNNICVTPAPSCAAPKVLQNNHCVLVCTPGQSQVNDTCVDPVPVCEAPKVLQNGSCVTPLPSCIPPQILQYKTCVTVGSLAKLNDTGMITCSDGTEGAGSRSGCGNGRYPGQDAEFGRDVYLNDDSDGHAGFSFTKIADNGSELPANTIAWSCVKDNVTGLVWEAKTDDGGLRDKDWGYSYYSPEYNPIGQYASATDVAGFIQAVNQQGLCGAHDWRLPTNSELLGIADFSHTLPGPAIDSTYFPHNRVNANGIYPFESHYWTSSPYSRDASKAWVVLFADGSIYDDDRNRPNGAAVRLVRGQNPSGPTNRFQISTDGQEVADNQTGLVWRRCVEGMAWDGNTCTGNSTGYMFEEALHKASIEASATGKNWRLPNAKELASLVDASRSDLLVDSEIFPATPNFQTWSATAYTQDGFFAWMVNFYYGWIYFSYTEDTGTARLVRDAEVE